MSAAAKRCLAMHVGTPKTGTTTLQILMGNGTAALAKRGVLVPQAGRGGEPHVGAHHGLANALLGAEGGYSAADTLAALLAELDASALPLALVSSENFCWLALAPQTLRAVRAGLDAIGYGARIVLYARDQAGLAESSYAEFVKQKKAWDVDAYVAAVLDRTSPPAQNAWRFVFDYAEVADRFADAFGLENVIVRPFDPRAPAAALVTDFGASIRGGEGGDTLFEFDERPHNPRLTFLDIFARLRENAAVENVAVPSVSEVLRDAGLDAAAFERRPFSFLDADDLLRIHAAFARVNAALAARYGTRVPLEHRSCAAPGPTPERRALRAASARWNLAKI